MGAAIRVSFERLAELTGADGPRVALARAHDAMELVGAATFAWIWLEQARAALRGGEVASVPDGPRREGIVLTCRDVFARVVPRAEAAAGRIMGEPPPSLDIDDAMLG